MTLVSGRRRWRASIERPIVPPPRRAIWWVWEDIVGGECTGRLRGEVIQWREGEGIDAGFSVRVSVHAHALLC